MRLAGSVTLLATLALAPGIALAKGDHHSAPEVHDHRSSSSDSGHSAPVVHDHRSSSDSTPVVHDHRSSSDSAPVVRDHRSSTSDGYYYESADPVIVDDTPSSGGFMNPHGPAWTLELGAVARRFTGPSITRSGTVDTTSGDTASYGLTSGDATRGDTAGAAFAMRITAPVTDRLYAGGELELGGLTRSPIRLMTSNSDLDLSRAMVGATAVVGARARHGIAELDGEVAGGFRVLSMTVQSMDAGEDDPSATETSFAGVVEARVRGALWVSPHVFLAAQAGVGILDRSDVNIGLSFGLSSHAFGGR
jgi:hypothetical protein